MNIKEVFLLLALSAVLVNCQYDEEEVNERAEKLAKMMQPDGVKRVVTMTGKNFKSLLRKHKIVVVYFHAQVNDTALEQDLRPYEVVAKLFGKRGVVCAACNLAKNPDMVKETGVFYAGTIKIFNHGKPTTYYGQRSPDVMVSYISKMFEPPVVDIISKTAKKTFDSLQMSKVVAYIQKGSLEYSELLKVARTFQPMIQFHAVFDAKIAKGLQMKRLNSLFFMKPFERTLKMPSKVSWKEKHLTEFINQNKRLIIRKMTLENLHEIWSPDTKGYMVAVFAKLETPVGSRFFSLIKSLARSMADNENLNFVWIDPDPYPAMKEYWKATFNIDPTKPTMGAVDLSAQSSTWLAAPDDREIKLEDLRKWTNDLLNGKLKLVPMKIRSETGEEERSDTEEEFPEKEEMKEREKVTGREDKKEREEVTEKEEMKEREEMKEKEDKKDEL
eukprot:gene11264-12444_t